MVRTKRRADGSNLIRTQNVFEPLKEVFEPLGVRTQLSGVRTLFTEFGRFKSSDLIRLENPIYFREELEIDSKALQITI